jgi:hypothetical protein
MHRTVGILVGAVSAVLLTVAGASAHPIGACGAPTDSDRCERWSATYDDPTVTAPRRSDQFPTDIAGNGRMVFTTLRNVALNPADPYAATAAWTVVAHDRGDGRLRWSASRNERAYDSPLAVAVAPAGDSVYVTGSSYDGFPVGATDSRIVTVAYDANTGAEQWVQSWDGLPNGVDAGKTIAISPDGRTVVVGGVTRTATGLDYVVIALDARDGGRQLWSHTVGGLRANGTDSLNAITIDGAGRSVYVTGESAGVAEYDLDYLTLAYELRTGEQLWSARFDGVGQQQPDRANDITVSRDGRAVYVTGDSWTSYADRITQYDYATVAYDARTGEQLWASRYAGATRGFNSAIGVVATVDGVVVSGQARGASTDDVRDFGTVAYDGRTGAELWRASYGPPRHDDIAFDVAVADDGKTAYVTGSSSPNIPYTDLDDTVTVAYRADGTPLWTSVLELGVIDSLAPRAVTAAGGDVALATQTTRSANPVEGPASDVYDAVIVGY